MLQIYKGLNTEQLNHIKQNKPYFSAAEEITDVPWPLLAGIWFRESFSVASPQTRGGPMQFDPPPSFKEIENLLYRHTHLTSDKILSITQKGINHFASALMIAGCFLQEKMDGALKPGCSDLLAMNAIWAYNGRVGKNATESAYVYNGFDKAHYPMILVGTEPDGHGGRKHIYIHDYRPGAYVVYLQLKNRTL